MRPGRQAGTPGSQAGARWRDLGAMWGAVAGRCPNCGAPGAFATLWGLRPACEGCGARFEREPGAWLGSWVLTYVVATLALVALAVTLILEWGLFAGLEWVLAGAGVLLVVALYRPVKGWWLWWLWAAGFVTPDDDGPPPS